MIDASIPLGVRPFQMEDPANTMAKVMGLKAAMSQDRAAQMQMADAEQARVRRNKMQELLGATPDDQLEGALRKGGFLEESMKIGKARRDNEETAAKTMKARAEAVAKKLSTYRDTLAGVNDAQTAGRWAAAMYADPDLKGSPVTAVPLESLVSEIPTDPAKFADWKNQFALGASKFIELNKPNTTVRNTGGTTDVLQTPGLGGPAQVVSSVKNTQSPDNAASVAATLRGQNLTDARAREGNEIQRNAARTQVVETPQGIMLVDKGTGLSRPAATMNGQPLQGKPSEAVAKELTSINQQRSVVGGALDAVRATPSAFSLARGTATMMGAIPESLAGRRDTDAERQARSYVFNNVSKVINERAGAAQSAQELARLRGFLPAETDNAEQIVSKLNAFQVYLNDLESGTRNNKPATPPRPAGLPTMDAIDAELARRRGAK